MKHILGAFGFWFSEHLVSGFLSIGFLVFWAFEYQFSEHLNTNFWEDTFSEHLVFYFSSHWTQKLLFSGLLHGRCRVWGLWEAPPHLSVPRLLRPREGRQGIKRKIHKSQARTLRDGVVIWGYFFSHEHWTPTSSLLNKIVPWPDPTFYFLSWICSSCRRSLDNCVLVYLIAGWTSRPARSLWLSAPSHSAWHSTAQQTTVTTAAGNTNTPTKKCIRRVFFVATTLQDGNKKKCPSQHPQYLVLKIAKKCFFPKKYSKPPVKAFV